MNDVIGMLNSTADALDKMAAMLLQIAERLELEAQGVMIVTGKAHKITVTGKIASYTADQLEAAGRYGLERFCFSDVRALYASEKARRS